MPLGTVSGEGPDATLLPGVGIPPRLRHGRALVLLVLTLKI
jgi:hypothetical protein